ncbi:MAG TPA: response regulator [Candidatus Acidoferrum sp.]|nr:response regulator [Candidatus Acidoferrum sp.]
MVKDQYKYFRIEARELLEGMSGAVLELERGGDRGLGNAEAIARILRMAHTLKGASRIVKQPAIADFAHEIEDIFAPYRDAPGKIAAEHIGRALKIFDGVAAKLAALDGPPGGAALPPPPPKPVSLSAQPALDVPMRPAITAESRPQRTSQPSQQPTQEPTQQRPPIAARDDGFETVRIELGEVDTLLNGVAETSVQLTALRYEIENLERARRLSNSLAETFARHAKFENEATGYSVSRTRTMSVVEELQQQLERVTRNLAGGVQQVSVELDQVRESAHFLRLLPASAIFAPLERVARDAAQSLGKQVRFAATGGSIRLDGHVLGGLREALLHVVRNCVAHGIESPDERGAAGKNPCGSIELRIDRRENDVVFSCRDDGRGIDVESVRRVAVERGLISPSTANSLDLDGAVRLILRGGLTTKTSVDEISGRGIGLDAVQEAATRLKGRLDLRSEPGAGTTIEIRVPVLLSALMALEVESANTVAAIPISAVRRTVRVSAADVARSAESDTILFDGEPAPFLPLNTALLASAASSALDSKRPAWSAVIVESSAGRAAIAVDRLRAAAHIVVRPLPYSAAANPLVSGASLNAEGDPQLVLDPEALVARARHVQVRESEAAPKKRACVLVIDDSLTTRMLEQSILESAGYEVEVATSAEEGLEKARARQYGLFLVDVEMPGMNGFEFVTRTRADAKLSKIPAILVTSRNAVEDRRRGEQAGASAYIVKGEFDQNYLLRMARELVGWA